MNTKVLLFSDQEISSLLITYAENNNYDIEVNVRTAANGEYLPGVLDFKPFIVIIEAVSPMYQLQNFFIDLREENLVLRFIIFQRRGNEIFFVMSNENSDSSLYFYKDFFTQALSPIYNCRKMRYHDQIWNKFFNLDIRHYERRERLSEILCGISNPEFTDNREVYNLDLRSAGYYLFSYDLMPFEYEDHLLNKDIYYFVGHALDIEFLVELKSFNGGELYHYSPNHVYIFINDFDCKSVASGINKIKLLAERFSRVGKCRTACLYLSSRIEKIEDMRDAYDIYQNIRNYAFFCKEQEYLTENYVLRTKTQVAYGDVNAILSDLRDSILFNHVFDEIKVIIRKLVFDFIKLSYNFSLYFYCCDSIIAVLDEKYGDLAIDYASRLQHNIDFLRYTSIEHEYGSIIGILEELARKKNETNKNTLVFEAFTYIKKHYTEDIKVQDIASHLHVNGNYLSQLFKRITGQSIINYLISYRLERAKQLLMNTNNPIANVALLSGFQNPRHFSKTFSKTIGISPKDYRKSTS
ncbi:MAG: helix-turn-helix transcriptional regulator [Clostridiales bacterium]|jgi:AraC-like DNA-binding protein|nr:helix-turn-helix transcriptional regulator [Clostridiales bacterium]